MPCGGWLKTAASSGDRHHAAVDTRLTGTMAAQVCGVCISDSDCGYLCERCAPAHACGEEMLLPVLNSPRMGMCGYGVSHVDLY